MHRVFPDFFHTKVCFLPLKILYIQFMQASYTFTDPSLTVSSVQAYRDNGTIL